MGEAWWNATARKTDLAKNQRDRLALTVVLGSLPEAVAEEIPFEPPEFEVEEEECCVVNVDSQEEAEAKEGARCVGSGPVGHLQRHRGCLLPSASKPPTYAAGLGQTGDTRSFRELDLVDPSASTLVGGQSQRSGPLRGWPLAVTAEGDLAGPGGGHAGEEEAEVSGGGQAGWARLKEVRRLRRPRKRSPGLPWCLGRGSKVSKWSHLHSVQRTVGTDFLPGALALGGGL